MGGEIETLEQVQAGQLAMTKVSTAALEEHFPEARVFGIPYLFRDEAHFWKVLNGPIGKEILEKGRPKGFFGLCYNRHAHLLEPAVRYFRELGAVRRADIVERARRVLEGIESPCCEHATEEDEAKIDALQTEYQSLDENYEAMLLGYVKSHPEEFPA